MGGSIIFKDQTRMSLVFPSDANLGASRYGTCPDSDLLDFGTNDFAIEFTAKWDSTTANPTAEKFIITKNNTWGLANVAGFIISIQPSTKNLSVSFNDGNATGVLSTWTNVFDSDLATFFRLEFDRDVGIYLYKDGAFVSLKTEITGRTGSISNSEPLIIGQSPGVINSAYKGSIGMIRFDVGPFNYMDATGAISTDAYYPVTYGPLWNYETYLKWKYFHPETLGDYRATWYFNNSLVDSSPAAHTFVFKDGNGSGATATYVAVYPILGVCDFTDEPLQGSHEYGPIDLDFRGRSLDGTMRKYKGPDKQRKAWSFRTDNLVQIIALQGAWYTSAPMQIYDNRDHHFAFRGVMASPPIVKELIRRGNYSTLTSLYRIWEVALDLEEL